MALTNVKLCKYKSERYRRVPDVLHSELLDLWREGRVEITDTGVSTASRINVMMNEERYFPTEVRAGAMISTMLKRIRRMGNITGTWNSDIKKTIKFGFNEQ